MIERAALTVPYCGTAPLPVELWGRWNLDPVLIALMAVAALAWIWRAWADPGEHRLFAAGFAVLVIAFLSPLCALSSALFSARALHHLLLVAVAAPLLALAWGDRGPRMPLGLTAAVHIVIFWLWHVPAFYGWALASDAAYWLMQASLLGSALAFWSAAVSGHARAPAVTMAFIAMIAQMGMLGALITFAPQPFYAPHFGVTAPWGLTALEDQQFAGLVMWVVSLPIYMAAALLILVRRMNGDREGRVAA